MLRGPARVSASAKHLVLRQGHTFICPPLDLWPTRLQRGRQMPQTRGKNVTEAVLVIGGSGLLGARVATASRDEFRTFATYVNHRFDLQGVEELSLDVTDYQQVHAIVRALRPRAVVLCGGL